MHVECTSPIIQIEKVRACRVPAYTVAVVVDLIQLHMSEKALIQLHMSKKAHANAFLHRCDEGSWHRVPDSRCPSPQPAVASDSLARRLTVPPPPTSPHPTYPTRPQNQLVQAARAWRRPQSALPVVESAGATARAWRTQAVSLPLPLTRSPSPRPPPSLPRASSGRRRRQLIPTSVS